MTLETALAIFGSVSSLGAMAGLFFAGREVGKQEVLRAWDEARRRALEAGAKQPINPNVRPEVDEWLDN